MIRVVGTLGAIDSRGPAMHPETITRRIRLLLLLAVPAAGLWFGIGNAAACGGFFCQSAAVDQAGERIAFTVNDDDTITTLIEIQYQGSADDFSWILPIPEAIGVDDLAVPDDGQAIFQELHLLTDVQIIAPPVPECAEILRLAFATADSVDEDAGDVEVFVSGEVGPFGFDVIGAEDPDALIDWLTDNDYRVDVSMKPLIDVYVQEQFAFVAMRLLDGETSDSITPIELTYPGTQPMIPLRLTAVAALPDMPIFTWIFADAQAVPTNYAHMEIDTAELTFTSFGINDYRRLVGDRADANDGRAFITEFAGPGSSLDFTHPYLADRADRYVTRLFTVISPEEMTVDPVFGFEDRPDVSNVRDAAQLSGLYDCQRSEGRDSDALDPFDGGNEVIAVPLSIAAVHVEDAAVDTEIGVSDGDPENGDSVALAAAGAEAAAAPAAVSDSNAGDSSGLTWIFGLAALAIMVAGLAATLLQTRPIE